VLGAFFLMDGLDDVVWFGCLLDIGDGDDC
jgi:hypothetical protein